MRHLYLHVPFCARRCSYCDFSIAVRKQIPAMQYVDAVLRELDLLDAAEREEGSAGLDTLYLGGGTPSLLPTDALHTLIASLFCTFAVAPAHDALEVTLEANPEDVTPAAARAWREAGITRVSLGAQSFDDRVLGWMHRMHSAARIAEAVQTLRAAGLDNVSLDLIFALPAELGRDWERDLDRAVALDPSHISLYGLTVEERTPLARWISRGASSAPDDERYAREYLVAHERLGRAGYTFYEVSNAARGPHRSRHNAAYWSGRSYRGLGPAAHSFDGRTRRWNVAPWEAYHRAIQAGRAPVESEERLSMEQLELERLYLSLRTSEGLPLTALERSRPPLSLWGEAGWVRVDAERVRCTAEGWLRLDALVRALTGPAATV